MPASPEVASALPTPAQSLACSAHRTPGSTKPSARTAQSSPVLLTAVQSSQAQPSPAQPSPAAAQPCPAQPRPLNVCSSPFPGRCMFALVSDILYSNTVACDDYSGSPFSRRHGRTSKLLTRGRSRRFSSLYRIITTITLASHHHYHHHCRDSPVVELYMQY